MDFKRIASNVVTRVAVALICALIFGVLGMRKAHAAPICGTPVMTEALSGGGAYTTYPTSHAAQVACEALPGTVIATGVGGGWYIRANNRQCIINVSNKTFNARWVRQVGVNNSACQTTALANLGLSEGIQYNNNSVFPWLVEGNDCATRPNQPTWSPPAGWHDAVCSGGCSYALNVPGPGMSPIGTTCSMSDTPEPVVDTDADGVPDLEDEFPNDPKESADSDGDGIGDNADFSPEDPADGQDTPGEEDGDDEGDNTASGGGTCDAPPTCSGDGIQCAQLFQQWKIRCNQTARGNVAGDVNGCTGSFVVTSPDPIANAQLIALRKIACNTEDIGGDGGSGNAVGDANGNGVADVLEGAGSDGEDPGEDDDVTRFGLGINTDMLNQENIFGGGQCPTMPSFQIYTASINPSDMPYWCNILDVMRVLIPLMAGWTALQILMGRNS